MEQLLKSGDLLRESVIVVVTGSLVGLVETDGVFTNICRTCHLHHSEPQRFFCVYLRLHNYFTLLRGSFFKCTLRELNNQNYKQTRCLTGCYPWR